MDLVLLDRDGVINESPGPGYILCPSELKLIKGSAEAIARLNNAHIKVAVVTNQSIVGQGGLCMDTLENIHHHLRTLLAQEGASIDKFYVCTDPPSAPTHRRKPQPGMLAEALSDFEAIAAHTPFIGDSLTDLQAAQAQGCIPYLVRTGHGRRTEEEGALASLPPVIIHDSLAYSIDHYMGVYNSWKSSAKESV